MGCLIRGCIRVLRGFPCIIFCNVSACTFFIKLHVCCLADPGDLPVAAECAFEHSVSSYSYLVLQMVSTSVCNSARTVCNSIAALSSPSKAVVQVKNTGILTGSFTISLGSCTHPMLPVPPQTVTVAATETKVVLFEVLFHAMHHFLTASLYRELIAEKQR
jgi:hypothetical protein